MKQPVDIGNYVFVDVPEDGFNFHLNWNFTWSLRYSTKECFECSLKVSDILDKKGNYEIVGLAKDLTEDQWKEIVEYEWKDSPYSKDAYKPYCNEDFYLNTATESGHSLVKSHGLELNNCLVLKKVL